MPAFKSDQEEHFRNIPFVGFNRLTLLLGRGARPYLLILASDVPCWCKDEQVLHKLSSGWMLRQILCEVGDERNVCVPISGCAPERWKRQP
jgi:hypothetical protein